MGCIDADFDEAMQSLIELQQEFKQDGIEAALEQSRRGGHLWIFCETPLLAAECKIYIYNLALGLGIPVKCAGIKDGIEVFPRQIVLKKANMETQSARRLAYIARQYFATGFRKPHRDRNRNLPISIAWRSSLSRLKSLSGNELS